MFKNLNEFIGEKVVAKDKDVNKKDLMFTTIDCTQDRVVVTIKNIINSAFEDLLPDKCEFELWVYCTGE